MIVAHNSFTAEDKTARIENTLVLVAFRASITISSPFASD